MTSLVTLDALFLHAALMYRELTINGTTIVHLILHNNSIDLQNYLHKLQSNLSIPCRNVLFNDVNEFKTHLKRSLTFKTFSLLKNV